MGGQRSIIFVAALREVNTRYKVEDREDMHIMQIRRPRFRPIYFETCPYNFNGAGFSCSYRSVGAKFDDFLQINHIADNFHI